MSQRQHHSSQRDHPSTAHLSEFKALRRAFKNCCKEKQDLENRMKQMQEEKSAEMIKMQEITVMRKKKEGLQVMFNEALGRNTQLLNKKQAGGFTPKSCYARSKTNPPRL